jgi:transposase
LETAATPTHQLSSGGLKRSKIKTRLFILLVMNTDVTDLLPNDIDALQRLARRLQSRIANLERIIRVYEEEKRLARAKRFAASSEKGALQYCLFDEAEQLYEAMPDDEEVTSTEIEVKSHKRRGGRKPLPEDLPRIQIIHELPQAERRCHCGCELEKIDTVVSEQIDIVPAQVTIIEHVRYKYGCQHCEQAPITAPLPPQPIPKSRASAGFLAYVITSKYADGIPLYRQCHALGRLGIEQERHTLAHQVIKTGPLIQPLINLLQDRALSYDINQMDETRTQVLKEPGRAANSDSFMWVMRGGPPDQPVILFDYDPSRSQSVPERLLVNYKGYLQTDGYAGYNGVLKDKHIIGVGCWQHARRKFTDAQTAIKRSDKQPHTKVQQALRFIGQLYAIEKRGRKLTPEERYALRQQKSMPVLNEFKNWLDHQHINPQGKLGEAITYLRNQWPRLLIYCQDGRLEIDNNGIENKIRPFAIGRKNWLFSTSQKGAKTSALLYSLIETAKANHLNEYAYLKYIFTELPKATCVEDYEKLLPWKVKPTDLDKMIRPPTSTNNTSSQ